MYKKSKDTFLLRCKHAAKKRGGMCMSDEYISAKAKLKWRCKKSHIFETTPDSVLRSGTWCPICSKKPRLSIEDMRMIANSRGGACLSQSYKSQKSILRWKCNENHVWDARAGHVRSGSWCPYCSGGTSENICRRIFELLFLTEFPKQRPVWLLNKSGRRMELDGFNERIKLAFEYQGRQHYEIVKIMDDNLEARRNYDRLKRRLCKKNEIVLVEIPYSIKRDDLENYIRKQCNKRGFPPIRQEKIEEKDLKQAYQSRSLSYDKLVNIAKLRRGLLLSEKYMGMAVKHEWQCEKGHIWKALPSLVQRGSWCAICSNRVPKTIEQMASLAKLKGGLCLSNSYVNSETKLEWQCSKGHVFWSSPNSIQQGRWCPKCAGTQKKTILEMKKLAESLGGSCLSAVYVPQKKLSWRCREGHKWKALSSTIIQGHWCGKCAKLKAAEKFKRPLAELQKIAQVQLGKCLSTEYKNDKSKAEWECSLGHTWFARPSHVKAGSWCPKCAIERRKSKVP